MYHALFIIIMYYVSKAVAVYPGPLLICLIKSKAFTYQLDQCYAYPQHLLTTVPGPWLWLLLLLLH